MNVSDKGGIHECTSCQMCAAVCPKQAISISLNDDGFYRPTVNNNCVECGLCKKVCYKFSTINEYQQYDQLINFAAASKDDSIITNTTSGGLGDVLCEQLIAEGYKCVGVVYNTEKEIAESVIVDNREDSFGFRGSKYIQSFTYPAFLKLVKNHIDDKIAVFGTPCQVYAIDKYLKQIKKRDSFILIDIYCHGCPSYLLWKKYNDYVKTKTGVQHFDFVCFRSKKYGWGTYYIAQMALDGKVLYSSPKINDAFYTLFFSDLLLNDSCYDCQIRSTMVSSDIRIGDFWGKPYLENKRGISLVTINPSSIKGVALFESIKNRVYYKSYSSFDCITYQSWGKIYKTDMRCRKLLLESLRNPKYTIEDTIQLYWNNKSIKYKIKQMAKNIVLMMPIPIMTFIKKIYR